jgi:hypothetical protein
MIKDKSMLKNYEIDKTSGIIKQIDKSKFNYDEKYSKQYDGYGELSNYISYLRLGFIVSRIDKYPESVLDVGYGNGAFLKCCLNKIDRCYGYDVSPYSVPFGCIRVNDLFEQHYELITFFDSLEHFEDIKFVEHLKCDYVCISVPWCHYYSDEWFELWKHRKPGEHLWHFNKESLINFMSSCGYDFICGFNLEDIVRKSKEDNNILTCLFKKKLKNEQS